MHEKISTHKQSMIERSYVDLITGIETCDLDDRYGVARKGADKLTALEMVRIDDLLTKFGIKQGDEIGVLVEDVKIDPETKQRKNKTRWVDLKGTTFQSVHEGKIFIFDPDEKNGIRRVVYDLKEIRSVRALYPKINNENQSVATATHIPEGNNGNLEPYYREYYRDIRLYNFGVK